MSYNELAVLAKKLIVAILSDEPVSMDVWVALAWCISIILVVYGLAMRAYEKWG